MSTRKGSSVPAPDSGPTPASESIFIVPTTNPAAYFIAIGKPYRGARLSRDGSTVEFMFDDSVGDCMEALLAFRARTAKHCDPLAILEARSFLSGTVRQILMGVRNGR